MARLSVTKPHWGEVWWADLPADKRRPVLILTRENFIEHLSAVLVAPVTTSVRNIPTEVLLSEQEGLPRECAANFDNTLTLPKHHLVARIGVVEADKIAQICRAYRFAADCS